MPVIGAVFEVWTRAGIGYVQYSHSDPENGQLLRVLPGLFANRLSDGEQDELVAGPESYFVFVDVDDDVAEGWFVHVGSFQVPSGSQGMPPKRFQYFEDLMRSVLLNGRQVFVAEFTAEQQRWSFLTHLPMPKRSGAVRRRWDL